MDAESVIAEREKRKARWQRWYAAVKNDPQWVARHRERNRADRLRNREKREAKQKQWTLANRERVKANWKAFYHANLEDQRAYSRRKAATTLKEWRKTYSDAYRRRNLLKFAEKSRRRFAKIGAFAKVDYALVVAAANGMCGICKMPMDNGPAHIDHIIPLSAGGAHSIENLQLSHARCNLQKGRRVPLEKVG